MGNFCLTDSGGQSLAPRGPKPKALMAYLLFHAGEDISREKLIDLFWTERGPKQGRDSLRQALHMIRTSLGDAANSVLTIDRQSVRAERTHLSFDLWGSEGIRWNLGKPFLEDLTSISSRFDDWVSDAARTVRQDQISAAELRLSTLDDKTDAEAVLSCAEAILDLDPHNEATARRAMRVLAEQGKRGHALRVFERLQSALKSDDFDVSDTTAALIKEISEDKVSSQRTQSAPVLSPSPKDKRGIPALRLEFVENGQSPTTEGYVSEFFDHLFLRFVHMHEVRLLTDHETSENGHYTVYVSIGRTNAGLRISLRLLAPDAQFIWSQRAELPDNPTDDQILVTVDRLVMQLLPSLEEHVFFNLGGTFETAYAYLLKAKRTFWTSPQSGYIENVLASLHRAIEIDPDFLPPYPMLIMYYNTGMFMSMPGVEHGKNRAMAFELSQKLLFLNSNYPNSHIAMGWCELWRGNFDAAERSIRRAMALQPYEPHRLNVIGTALVYLGRFEEGEAYYNMAQERIQHDFDFQRTDYGELHFFQGNYEEALSWMEAPEIRTPYKTYYFRAMANAQLGRMRNAKTDLDAFVEDIEPRWASDAPFSPEIGFQWYTSMLPLRRLEDRETVQTALAKLDMHVVALHDFVNQTLNRTPKA